MRYRVDPVEVKLLPNQDIITVADTTQLFEQYLFPAYKAEFVLVDMSQVKAIAPDAIMRLVVGFIGTRLPFGLNSYGITIIKGNPTLLAAIHESFLSASKESRTKLTSYGISCDNSLVTMGWMTSVDRETLQQVYEHTPITARGLSELADISPQTATNRLTLLNRKGMIYKRYMPGRTGDTFSYPFYELAEQMYDPLRH